MMPAFSGCRLGFFTSVIGHGGSEVQFADTIAACVAAGADAVVWSHPDAAVRELLASDTVSASLRDWPTHAAKSTSPQPVTTPTSAPMPAFNIRRLIPFAAKRWLGFRRDAKRLAALLQAERLDGLIVNVNGSEAASVAGALAGVPTVNVYHLSWTPPPGNALTRWADERARSVTLHAAKFTIHISQAVSREWSERYRYPLSRTAVIYNGVATATEVDRDAVRGGRGLSDDTIAFAVPARFDPIKGHDVLFDALALLATDLPPYCILLCGDGPLRVEYEARCRNLPMVRFLGWRSDLPAILAAVDAVVLPSLRSENLSLAVLEGMRAGTPAIVTAVGGMAEAVTDGTTGFVVPAGDARKLADAIRSMILESELRLAMGRAAKADADRRFSRERMRAEYVARLAEFFGKEPR